MAGALESKLIVVTGAASGIGEETARQISAAGGRVLAVDINRPSVPTDGYFEVDLSREAEVDDLVKDLPHAINGLANIAGLPPTRPAAQVLTVNLLATKRLTLGVIGKMADGGSIVNVASLMGAGWQNAVAQIKAAESLEFDGVEAFCQAQGIVDGRSYAFSKEALIAWTLQNRWTWRDRGIRMNVVSPGPVVTPISGDFAATLGEKAQAIRQTMERPAHPNDIAPLIVFLLSDGSAWLRGTNISADGGMQSHLLVQQAGL
jgi:NAD(P)-dependent dehydrogenase (short-subunit alcohol dehydrogenase family)